MKTCYCKDIKRIDPGIRFILLMHPREAYRQKTGTGRLAHLSLSGSEIIVGVDFTNNIRVNEIISNPDNLSVTLYPGDDALPANMISTALKDKERQVVVFLIDATWAMAKKMLKLSTNIRSLPKISFSTAYRSEYEFKTQPEKFCLSTIESIYYLIKEFQDDGLVKSSCNSEQLMELFRKMISFQLQCEKENRV